jgi:hypothetical protein
LMLSVPLGMFAIIMTIDTAIYILCCLASSS